MMCTPGAVPWVCDEAAAQCIYASMSPDAVVAAMSVVAPAAPTTTAGVYQGKQFTKQPLLFGF